MQLDAAPKGDGATQSAKLLGEKIRHAREKRGWTQSQLADRVGSISKNSVSLWESGKTRPSMGHLMKLPSILGVDSVWLFSDEAPLSVDVAIISPEDAGKLQPGDSVEIWNNVPRVTAAGLPPGRWVAMFVEDETFNLVAIKGSIVFVNRDETALEDGKPYLVSLDGAPAMLRRYRANPDRFEMVASDGTNETIFDAQARVIGRVRRVQADL